MNRIILISLASLLMLFFCSSSLRAQDKYWLAFTDKQGAKYNPLEELHPDAVARRNLEGLDLYDSTDFPVSPIYLQSISALVDSVSMTSRWFNAVVFFAKQDQIAQIEALPFVAELRLMNSSKVHISQKEKTPQEIDDLNLAPRYKEVLQAQTEILGSARFRQEGIGAKGVRVAVLDAGFTGANTHQCLQHLFESGQIEMAYDFVGRDENPYHGSGHGTAVLSCIAGNYGDQIMGLAVDATFLLARTERNFWEFASEEEHWLEAAEWADRNGAHVINSSLGYTKNRYFWEDMDGKTSLASRAANMAAKKGILVLSSAGNDGDAPWQIIGAPADADSVLAIGGITPWTGFATSFSSFGPNAAGISKPNISAFGYAMCADGKQDEISMMPGTSFASPLAAGFVACAKQAFPNLSWQEMFDLVQRSGHLYPYFDEVHGYGIPSADRLFDGILEVEPQFEFERKINSIEVLLLDEISTNQVKMSEHPPYVFWKVVSKEGRTQHFAVVLPEGKLGASIPKGYLNKDNYLQVFYSGYMNTYRLYDEK